MTDTGAEAAARAAAVEAGRVLFARPWAFVSSVPRMDVLPAVEGVEVAFAGRSNVGKSSLINALTGRSGLARTSNTPGRTQELILFRPEPLEAPASITLVDMPGYGYAEAPKEKVEAWTRLVFSYLRGRPNLRRVYLLVDARHGLKAADLEALATLDRAAVSYQVVLTKADKIGKSPEAKPLLDVVASTLAALRKRPAAHPVVLATSSEKGWGLPDLRAEIAAFSA